MMVNSGIFMRWTWTTVVMTAILLRKTLRVRLQNILVIEENVSRKSKNLVMKKSRNPMKI